MSDLRGRVIPDATIARLPVYHRCLLELQAEGRPRLIEQLADLAGVNAAKVRKDLSYFGTYGTRGVGYEVEQLLVEIRSELGLDHDWPCVIVGAGNLGSALAKFAGFPDRGFTVVAVVDIDEEKVGQKIGGVVVHHQTRLGDLVRERGRDQDITRRGARSTPRAPDRVGRRSILNFAPTVLDVPSDVLVRDVDVAVGRRSWPSTAPHGRLRRGQRRRRWFVGRTAFPPCSCGSPDSGA